MEQVAVGGVGWGGCCPHICMNRAASRQQPPLQDSSSCRSLAAPHAACHWSRLLCEDAVWLSNSPGEREEGFTCRELLLPPTTAEVSEAVWEPDEEQIYFLQ